MDITDQTLEMFLLQELDMSKYDAAQESPMKEVLEKQTLLLRELVPNLTDFDSTILTINDDTTWKAITSTIERYYTKLRFKLRNLIGNETHYVSIGENNNQEKLVIVAAKHYYIVHILACHTKPKE